MKIRITKEHLGNKFEDYKHCPLARAVREVLPHALGVNISWVMDNNYRAIAKIHPPFTLKNYEDLKNEGIEFETELTMVES